MSAMPDLLVLDPVGPGLHRLRQPSESAEGRDVVYSGQLLAQMIMAAEAAVEGAKDVKSVHAIFARAGTYTLPIELATDVMQSGRTWASATITATQADKLLCRSLALLSIDDPDLMRHDIDMPAVPKPADCDAGSATAFPGAEVRPVDDPDATTAGVPAMAFWVRVPGVSGGPAVHQAVLSWATPGAFIGLAMRAHPDKVRISDAHHTISTGVIGHTVNFHERFDVTDWLLVFHEATYAGRGRVHGRGLVFTEDGRLVATTTQDSMARSVEGTIDHRRGM
jgi:acyl-CoA thioesterase-2